MFKIIPGRVYTHYKGKNYKILGVGYNSEKENPIDEPCVIYQSLYPDDIYGQNALWVRPIDEFLSDIEIDGQVQPRFKPMDFLKSEKPEK